MEKPPIVTVDESGNSGENILDSEQPVFVLAAVHIDEAEAERLAVALAGDADEAHYTRMRKRAGGQSRILDLLRDPALDASSVRIGALHKPFMAEAKFVDFLFEPVMAAAGYDLYADGWHTRLSELFHGLGRQASPTYWDPMMVAFVQFIWRGTAKHAVELTALMELAAAESEGHPVGEFLAMVPRDPMLLVNWYGCGPSDAVTDSLDPALAAAVEQVVRWGDRLGPFLLVYDESKLMGRWADRLLALADPAVAAEYAVTPTNSLPPLRLAGLAPATSHDSAAVQLADALAGAVADLLRAVVRGDELSDWQLRLREARVLRFVENYVWPPRRASSRRAGGAGAQ